MTRRSHLTAPLMALGALGLLAGTTPAHAAQPAAAQPAIPPVVAPQLMMLLDASGSMSAPDSTGKPKIDAARTAMHQVVGGLPSDARAGMRVFGATVKDKASPKACTDSQLAVPVGSGNTAALNQAVDAYKPFGETPMAYAMQQAASDLGPSGQRSMILVSDGEDTCSPDPCKVAQQIADQGIDLKIDVVGFRVSGKAQQDLQCIAKTGRGSYYDADNTQDLTASLKTLSTRAFRPFSVTGKPVAGTPIVDGAPTITPGQWTSKVAPDGDTRYYQVKHTPGTTLHVSAVGRPGSTSDNAARSIGVSIARTDGRSCYGSDSTWSSDWSRTAMPIGAVARVDANDEDCGHAENLTVKVKTGAGDKPQQTLGPDAMPFELRVVQENPVTNVPSLPAPAESTSGSPADWSYDLTGTPATGGAGFSDALEIKPNTTYAATLLPGEVQIFKVPVRYGQTLVGRTNVAPPSLSMKAALESSKESLDVRMSLFNPERQSYSGYESVNLSDYTSDRQDMASDTRQLNWRNREDGMTATYLAGSYYIAVAAKDVPTGGAPVSFLVRGDVTGTPTGQPAYGAPGAVQAEGPKDGESPSPSPSASSSSPGTPTGSASPTAGSSQVAVAPVADDGDDGGLPMPLLIGGGVAVIAALIGGGVWMALRSKGSQTPPNPPQSIGQTWQY